MKIKRRGIALMVVGAACAAPVAAASATEGSLYPVEPGAPQITAPWTATPSASPGVWEIAVPAAAVTDGTKLSVPFACPAPGSEIEIVEYERLRSAAPSSFGADVIAEGIRIFRDPDVDWPQDTGSRRRVPVGNGACAVSLDLVQSQARSQHKRTWFLGAIKAYARDTQAPQVDITALPEVVGPGAEAVSLRYTVADNFGADGVAEHRIELDNTVVARRSGVGTFTVPISVEGLKERDHTIRVVAEGDGTPAGVASRQFGVDRSGPDLVITTTRRGAKNVAINVRGPADLREWDVRVSSYISAQRVGIAGLASAAASLPLVASGKGSRSTKVDLSGVRRGELVRLVVYARDASGNLRVHRAPFVYTGRTQKPQLTTNSRDIVGKLRQRRKGLANRVETRVGARVAVGGLLRLMPSGETIPLTQLTVRDPSGRRVAGVRTNERGKYVARFRPRVSGVYRVFMEGQDAPIRALRVVIRPRLGVITRPASRLKITAKNRDLILPGTLKAGSESGDVRVNLQLRVGKRWRNVTSDFTNGSGSFRLIYRPNRTGKNQTLVMRARVAADPGRVFSAATTKPFKLTVSKKATARTR